MLKEIHKTRQIPGQGPRRWFSDACFDLFIWEDGKGGIDGFQFCYGKGGDEHALTWRKSGSCTHHRVDDGENPGLEHKGTPILLPDGQVDTLAIVEDFRARSADIDPDLSDFVQRKLIECLSHQDDPRQ